MVSYLPSNSLLETAATGRVASVAWRSLPASHFGIQDEPPDGMGLSWHSKGRHFVRKKHRLTTTISIHIKYYENTIKILDWSKYWYYKVSKYNDEYVHHIKNTIVLWKYDQNTVNILYPMDPSTFLGSVWNIIYYNLEA